MNDLKQTKVKPNNLKQIKVKVKVTVLDKKHRKLARILEEYHSIAHWKVIEAIRFEIFAPNKNFTERQKAYEDYKDVVLKLKPIFKKLIIERNRLARNEGYKNYFEFITQKDGIPKEKINLFFTKADKIIEDINHKLPLPKTLPDWYWSEFNIPDALDLVKVPKYSIPEDIYKTAEKIHPEIKRIISRIKVETIKGFYPRTEFINETKSVVIETPTKPSIYNALTFVHELGHAIEFIKLAEKGIDPLSKSKYWQEKQAYQFKFKFEEKCLPEKIKDASRGGLLSDFFTALFEWTIYTNPNQDFDEAYAKTFNRCYPHIAGQKKNPFYVLENGLVLRPCSVVTASVAEAELYC